LVAGMISVSPCTQPLVEMGCKEIYASQAPVAHAHNPSYSGGRDQEDRSSKPALGN
jgi:hypothetical protein